MQHPIASAVFAELIPGERLRVVDAGAAGAGEAHRWGFLGRALELHSFEADETDYANMLKVVPPGAVVRNYNMFLGRPQAQRTFYIGREYNNSFYPTDYGWYARRASFFKGFKERQSEVFEVERTIEVESVCLDEWARRAGVDGIDYLKVDIEGAELELMEHSPDVMAGVLGVSIDVIFHADWIGAPTFAEIDTWMRGQGFVLFDIFQMKRGTLYDTPVTAPRNHPVLAGQLACADAVYFRDPLIEGAAPMTPARMLKLACIAEVHGQVEFAFELLRAAGRSADAGIPAERLAAVEQQATAAYRRMIDGQARAVWRNRLARTVRTVVPKPLWSLSRRAAAALGLGGNPLVPNR